MASVTITIPDAIAPRLRDAFCTATNYPAQIPNPAFDPLQPPGPGNEEYVANPVSKMEWVKAQIIEWVKSQAKSTEMRDFDAQQCADRITQETTLDADFNLS